MNSVASLVSALQQQSDGFSKLKDFISPAFVAKVLAKAKVATVRRRRLPLDSVIWLLVGYGLFRNMGLREVAETLTLCIDGVPAASSLCDARKRLGSQAVKLMFQELAADWTQNNPNRLWRGLRVLGVDGTVIKIPDSDENAEYFGKPKARPTHRAAAFPQLRMTGLMDLSSKLLVDAIVSSLSVGEQSAVWAILPKIGRDSLTIFDRGFCSAAMLQELIFTGQNRHFIVRLRSNTRRKVIKKLADGSYLADLTVTKHPYASANDRAEKLPVRVIEYHVKGFSTAFVIATSLLDSDKFPSDELAKLYHVRWEYELGLRDLKTTLMDRGLPLRSQSPDAVAQEVWAVLLVFNLVRREMLMVANQHEVSPSTISFSASLNAVCAFFIRWSSTIAPIGKLPAATVDLRRTIWTFRLPPRRLERHCPRVVKQRQQARFPRKQDNRPGKAK